MTNTVAVLSTDLVANDKISAVLARLHADLAKANQAATRTGAGIGQSLNKGASTASDGTLRLAQAQARLLSTTGQTQAAFDTLAPAINRSTGNVLQVTQAKTHLAQIQNRLSGQTQSLTSLFGGLGQQLSGLGGNTGALAGNLGNLAGSFGTLGVIGAGIGLAKVSTDMAVAGANAQLLRTRFDGLATAAGTTGEALLKALRAASGGEISDLNLQLAANKAQLLGVADSAEEFGVLMGIARDRAQQMGISTTQAFNDLVTGLGRGSALILDNLGIMISVTEANEQYAASVGKTVAQLTEAETKQALINQVLAQGKASLDATGGAVTGTASTFAQLGAAADNASTQVGGLLAKILDLPAKKVVEILVSVSGGLDQLATADAQLQAFSVRAFEGAQTLTEYQARVAAVNGQLAPFGAHLAQLSAVSFAYAQSLQASGASADVAFAKAQQYSGIIDQVTLAQQEAGASAGTWGEALDSLGQRAAATAALSDSSNIAVQNLALAYSLGGINALQFADMLAILEQRHAAAATAALDEEREQRRLSGAMLEGAGAISEQAQALVDQTQKSLDASIAADKLAAFQATLASLGGQVSSGLLTSGQAALIMAGQYGVASGEAERLIRLQAQLGQAKTNAAALLDQRAGERDFANGRTAKQIQFENDQDRKATASRVRRAKEAEAAIAKAKRVGGGGGGAAAPKLSDQQKLNNQLAADQTRFDQRSEDAELAHLQRILKINEDFAERMKDAQSDFAQSQLEGRAGFYDTLGSIEDAGLRQALSAQYEAAFQEADAIAREKGADVGEAFLAARQAAIQAQGKRASEIQEAEKEGDAGKAEYLRGVDELHRRAEQAKLDRIKEGGDSLAAERDKQLAEEGAKYEEATDKIMTAAERAAAAKEAAAIRGGKAVDVERLQVDQLAASYDRVAQAATRTGGNGVAPVAPAVTSPAAPGATGDAIAAQLAALEAIRAAVDNAANLLVRAEQDTTRAIRAAANTGGVAG